MDSIDSFIVPRWEDAVLFALDPLRENARKRPPVLAFCQNCPAQENDKVFKVTFLGTAVLKTVTRNVAFCPDCKFALYRSNSYRMKGQILGASREITIHTREVIATGSVDRAIILSLIRQKQAAVGTEWVIMTGPEFRAIMQWCGLATITSHLSELVAERYIDRVKCTEEDLEKPTAGRKPCKYRVLNKSKTP